MVQLVPTFRPMVTLAPMVPLAVEKRSGFSGYQWYHWLTMVPLVTKFPTVPLGDTVPLGESRTHAISFKVLPMIPSVIQSCTNGTLGKTVGCQYGRQSTVWAILPTREMEMQMIQYGVINFRFISVTNKHCFYHDYISKL